MGESALLHAKEALRLCLDDGIDDLDQAFGYEAVARPYSCLGSQDDNATFMEKARKAATGIADEGSRRYMESEISTIR